MNTVNSIWNLVGDNGSSDATFSVNGRSFVFIGLPHEHYQRICELIDAAQNDARKREHELHAGRIVATLLGPKP